MLDIATFRTIFPGFASTTTYPDAAVTFWLNAAPDQVNLTILGDSADLATALFVAHNLVLAGQVGGALGGVNGPVTSKSVGSVSKSVDTGSSAFANAGAYNLTSFGRQLYSLLRKFSLGGVYVAAPRYNPDYALLMGRGWLPPFGY